MNIENKQVKLICDVSQHVTGKVRKYYVNTFCNKVNFRKRCYLMVQLSRCSLIGSKNRTDRQISILKLLCFTLC